MSKDSRKELLSAIQQQYRQSDRKTKADLLTGFVAATGYCRKYAIGLLSKYEATAPPLPHQRKRFYDEAVAEALRQVWLASNCLCSKRLVPFLPRFLPQLEKFGHLHTTKGIRDKLLSISPATADRILKPERSKKGRGFCVTKPGSMLKHQIPVRTFSEWNDCEPGFLEADTVAHCGPVAKGQFLSTLTLTDIASGWTELAALDSKTESAVAAALSQVASIIPFPVKGLDTDNGSEFINNTVVQWCVGSSVTFTRSREYKKNDQAHVEQKNGSIVRQFVGYNRYAGSSSLDKMQELYRVVRLYVNFFQPSMKLCAKERLGTRVRKKYFTAKTPCEQLLQSKLPELTKRRLRSEMARLDPVALLNQIQQLQVDLFKQATVPDPALIAQQSLLSVLPAKSALAESLSASIEQPRSSRRGRKKLVPLHPPLNDGRTPRQRVLDFVREAQRRKSFEIRELLHLGPRFAIDQTLHRLLLKGKIKRIARGVYQTLKDQ